MVFLNNAMSARRARCRLILSRGGVVGAIIASGLEQE